MLLYLDLLHHLLCSGRPGPVEAEADGPPEKLRPDEREPGEAPEAAGQTPGSAPAEL